jgi:hypothetical protein
MVRRRSIRERTDSISHPFRPFASWATAHPALIPHETPGNSREPPRIPALKRLKALLAPGIPAYSRSCRKRHDRPVTPEVAGSSPVAPASQNTCKSAFVLPV